MNWKRSVAIAAVTFLFVSFYVINHMKRQHNHVKYDKTISEITAWADRYEPDSRLPTPNSDAWGRPIIVKRNEEQIIIMSQGADITSTNDDIVHKWEMTQLFTDHKWQMFVLVAMVAIVNN